MKMRGSYLVLERVNFCLKLFVLLRAVEESQVDNVSGVLESQGCVLVSGLAEVDPVHGDDFVATSDLRTTLTILTSILQTKQDN